MEKKEKQEHDEIDEGELSTLRYPMLRSRSALSDGKMRRIRRLLNHQTRAYDEEARRALASIEPERRDAEWYFLAGCLQHRHGHMVDAQAHIDRACELGEEQVPEYREVYDKILSDVSNDVGGDQTLDRTEDKQPKDVWGLVQDGCCECCCEVGGTMLCECVCESISGCG